MVVALVSDERVTVADGREVVAEGREVVADGRVTVAEVWVLRGETEALWELRSPCCGAVAVR